MAGSSDFPTSVDNKTQLQDGIDYIEADNVNNAYVPINKTQTFIGASGAGQASNTDILGFLRFALDISSHMRVEYSGVGTLVAKAGIVFCSNSSGTIRVMRRNTSDTNVTFADIDTGAEAASTKYYLHAVADATATTVTFKISTSATAPSGVTTFFKLCSFVNDGSSNIAKNSIRNTQGSRRIVDSGVFEAHFMQITDLPEGRIHCDGAAYSRTLYSELYAKIGTVYGTGDGSTTFNVPQTKDYMLMGAKQDSGGVAKSNYEGSLYNVVNDTGAKAQPPYFTYPAGPTSGASGPTSPYAGSTQAVIQPYFVAVVAITA